MASNIQDSSLFHQKYHIDSQIGRGASGVCYKIKKFEDGRTYALKKISSNFIKKNNIKGAYNQVTILSSLQHVNIIKYYESFMDLKDLYIVMQYASKGDLHSLLKKRKLKRQFFDEKELWKMIQELLQALDYLHSKNVIHRDLKTLNIFVDDNYKLFIGDLGVSKIIKSDLGLYSRVGTPLYLPPEIIKYEKYDFKADVWGLGCVSYILTTLNHPFEGKNIISLGQNIVNSQPKPIEKYSSNLSELIFEMLQKDSNKRASAAMLLKKYFSKNDIYEIIKAPLKKEYQIQQIEIEEFQEDNNKQSQSKKSFLQKQKNQRMISTKHKSEKIQEKTQNKNKIYYKVPQNFQYQKKLSYLIGNFVSNSLDMSKQRIQDPNIYNRQFDSTIILKPKKSLKAQNQIGNEQVTKNEKQLQNSVKKPIQRFNCLRLKQAQLILKSSNNSQKKIQANNFLKVKVNLTGTKNNIYSQSLQSFPPTNQLQQIKKVIQSSQNPDYLRNCIVGKESQDLNIIEEPKEAIKVYKVQRNNYQVQSKRQPQHQHLQSNYFPHHNIQVPGMNKIRNRPKSSIGRRDVNRESSNIKPKRKQLIINSFSSIIQTKILKKPQVIVL